MLQVVVVLGLVVVLGPFSAVVQAFVADVFLRALFRRSHLRSICLCTECYGYFFSCGFCFSSSSWICAASRSSVFLPSLVMVLPFGVFSTSPAVSSCCMIFLMFVPAPFRACSLLTFLPVLPP